MMKYQISYETTGIADRTIGHANEFDEARRIAREWFRCADGKLLDGVATIRNAHNGREVSVFEVVADAPGFDRIVETVSVPGVVRQSMFGCSCCLWAGAECKQGSRYQPGEREGNPICVAYAYND